MAGGKKFVNLKDTKDYTFEVRFYKQGINSHKIVLIISKGIIFTSENLQCHWNGVKTFTQAKEFYFLASFLK